MEMRTFDKRQLYSLIVIVLGIFITGIYSSYALPDVETYSDDMAYALETNNLGTYTIAANTTKTYDVTIKNNSTGTIKYAVYYQLENPTAIPSGFTVTKSAYSVNDSTGNLDKDTKKVITISINNNSSSVVTVKIGVVPGFANSQIVLPSGQYAIS